MATTGVHQTELLLYFTLLQLAIIVLAGRLGSTLALRVGQTAAVGEIIVGILLGPSLFGVVAPDLFHYAFRSSSPEPMQMLSQLGLILLMFQIGLEFDFSHLREKRNRTAVTRVAALSLVLPFALGLVFGYLSAPILSPKSNLMGSALFVATAFSITALPILGRILIDFGMTRAPLGVIAISAAAINDVIGWMMLALVTALTVANFDAGTFGLKVGLVLGFMLLCWYVVRPLLKGLVRRAKPRDGRLSNNLLGILLVAVFLAAMATYLLGIFAIFGGFMLGVILHDEPELVAAWKERIGQFVLVFFLPIFFTYTGLRTNIGGLDSVPLWGWCALTLVLATIGKFGGAYAAARWSGLDHNEASVLGILMNTRALMELIIINVGLDLGVISQNMFTMLVIMAIVSTVVTTPGLNRWLPRTGFSPSGRPARADAPEAAPAGGP
jgi:Kef-type K+ transport system membrane component KefB